MTSQPQITSYLDITHFIKDLYIFRKRQDRNFSYQKWAEELGFKSRSFVRLLATGQRGVTESNKHQLVQGFGLQGLEKIYFENLVTYSQESDLNLKATAFKAMLGILRFINEQKEVQDDPSLLSSPHIPSLLVLLAYKDIVRTPESLAKSMDLPCSDILSWLQILEKIELVKKNDDGQWVPFSEHVKIGEKLGSKALQTYHAAVLRLSAEAIHLPLETRRFRTLLMPLSPEEYEDFGKKINEFASSTLAQYSSSELNGKRLYRLALALAPITIAESSSSEYKTKKETTTAALV